MNRLHLSCRDGDGANKERMNELSRSSDTPVVQHSVVEHGGVTSLILMVTPQGRGSTAEQLVEALQAVDDTLRGQRTPQHPVTQTVFLRDLRDRALCEKIFAEHYRNAGPVSTYVQQPPCDGAALAIELCAVGGPPVRIGRPAPDVLVAGYHGIQITYCGGVSCPEAVGDVYEKALDGFRQMKQKLARAGVNFDRVIRTWLYLGDITGPERRCDGACFERYMELNRARTDFYENIRFGKGLLLDENREGIYPASTGIGMDGHGIVMSCVALETRRDDVFLQPLENPQQTPVYHYEPVYSPKSPKFSRAMAVVADGCATLWISGTASIVNSKTVHVGDPRRQTEQTIENIERLISAENLARHGIAGSGARLSDVVGLRVYVKRLEDYPVCRAVCEERFGKVPILYTNAGVCRSDLLVEIEGIAHVQRAFVD